MLVQVSVILIRARAVVVTALSIHATPLALTVLLDQATDSSLASYEFQNSLLLSQYGVRIRYQPLCFSLIINFENGPEEQLLYRHFL